MRAAAPYTLPTTYRQIIDGFFANVAADSNAPGGHGSNQNVYATTAQYGDSTSSTGRYDSQFGGDVSNTSGGTVDSSPYPADDAHGNSSGCDPALTVASGDPAYTWCLTDAQIQQELQRLIAANGLPSDNRAIYFVYLPPGVDECFSSGPETSSNACADKDFCAYHSSVGTTSAPLYAVQPWADVKGCQTGQHPNADPADDTVSVASHEHNETITDPFGTSWVTAQGNEVGDLCVGPSGDVFGPALGGSAGAQYDQIINGGHYYIQDEYANADNGLPLYDSCEPHPGYKAGGDGVGTATGTKPDAGPLSNPPPGSVAQGPVIRHHTTYSIYWYPGSTDAAPTASFTQSATTAHVGDTVTFNGSASSDPQGQTLTYAWDFGDGQLGSGPVVDHQYTTPGDHPVTLTVTDRDKFSGSGSHTIHIYTPPAASFTGPNSPAYTGQPLTFDASSAGGPDAPITSYAWHFSDGATASGVRVSHTFTAASVYTVTLTVTDANGSTDTRSQQFTLVEPPNSPGGSPGNNSPPNNNHTTRKLKARIAASGHPTARLKGRNVIVITGRALTCPAGTSGCTTKLALTTRTTSHRHTRTVTVGSATVFTRAGHTSLLTVTLNRQGRSLLNRLHHLRLTARISTGGANVQSAAQTLTFTIPQPHTRRG